MQLHTLTETARTILAQHGETRFFWRYDDPYVCLLYTSPSPRD